MAKNRPTGRCPLCLETRLLCDSHLIAAGFSRRLHNKNPAESKTNPNPVLTAWGVQVPTSSQFTRYVFCDHCEQLFRECGEDYVIQQCAQTDSDFPLLRCLRTHEPIQADAGISLFSTNGSGVQIDKLTHFAAGVIWRASVSTYTDGKHETQILQLGRYGQQLRRYLLKQTEFPGDIALLIVASTRDKILLTTGTPVTIEGYPYHRHTFHVPGLGFDLYIGKAIRSSGLYQCCLVHGQQHPIVGSDDLDKVVATAQYLAAHKKVVGTSAI